MSSGGCGGGDGVGILGLFTASLLLSLLTNGLNLGIYLLFTIGSILSTIILNAIIIYPFFCLIILFIIFFIVDQVWTNKGNIPI